MASRSRPAERARARSCTGRPPSPARWRLIASTASSWSRSCSSTAALRRVTSGRWCGGSVPPKSEGGRVALTPRSPMHRCSLAFSRTTAQSGKHARPRRARSALRPADHPRTLTRRASTVAETRRVYANFVTDLIVNPYAELDAQVSPTRIGRALTGTPLDAVAPRTQSKQEVTESLAQSGASAASRVLHREQVKQSEDVRCRPPPPLPPHEQAPLTREMAGSRCRHRAISGQTSSRTRSCGRKWPRSRPASPPAPPRARALRSSQRAGREADVRHLPLLPAEGQSATRELPRPAAGYAPAPSPARRPQRRGGAHADGETKKKEPENLFSDDPLAFHRDFPVAVRAPRRPGRA
jgi:hypothetical protein